MANYYHEARAHVRSLKQLETDNKRRGERRAEVANAQAEHPLNLLAIDGRPSKLYKNSDAHAAAERGDGLISWAVQPEATIDRFDARALLDMYRDYDSETAPKKAKTPEEERLAKLLMFESYRDLVRLEVRGLSEREGLAAAVAENIEIRAAARAAAMAAYAANGNAPQPMALTTAAAGQGPYAAVGFSYGGSAPSAAAAGSAGPGMGSGTLASDDSSSSSEDEDDDEEGAGVPGSNIEAMEERADEHAFDRYGIEDFSYRLHKALQQEGEAMERMGKAPRRRHGRKKARERARRMAGQGLNVRDWRDPANAPGSHRPGRRSASRSRSRSRSPAPGPAAGPAFALLMKGPRAAGAFNQLDRRAFERDDNEIIDALPDRPDPAMVSAQPKLTDLVTIHGIKPPVRRDRSRSRSRDRGRGVGRGRSRSRDRGRGSRSRSRSRGRSRDGAVHRHSRSGSRSRERHRSHQRSSSRDRSRSRGRGRRSERSEERAAYRDRSRDRDRARHRDRSGSRERDRRRDRSRSRDASRERGRGGDKSSIGGGGSGSAGAGASKATGGSGGHSTAAAAARAGSGAGASAGSGSALGAVAKSETPQERLKRIMAVQLTKQAQKDQAVTHVKRMQAEREKQARASLDKVVLPRNRSPSPPRHR